MARTVKAMLFHLWLAAIALDCKHTLFLWLAPPMVRMPGAKKSQFGVHALASCVILEHINRTISHVARLVESHFFGPQEQMFAASTGANVRQPE